MRGLRVEPVTADRWDDLLALFGDRGAYGGCWCMYFRQTSAEFDRGRGARNRAAMRRLVASDDVPGLLASLDGAPVGWVSVAPRERFTRVERSRTTKPIDDQPVWSVVCFYIDRHHRGAGVATALLEAAVAHAARNGASIVEGYPLDKASRVPNAEAYYGTVSMFRAAGFREAARRSDVRPIMRRRITPAAAARARTRSPAGTRTRSAAGQPRGTARRRSSAPRAGRRS